MLEKLQNGVKTCSTLEELVNCFFNVAGKAEGEIEYVAGDLREYILGSEVYGMLKDKGIINVDVYDGET